MHSEPSAFAGWGNIFSESESEKEELSVNWFDQLFQQTKNDIEETNEDYTSNETTTATENIATTTTSTATSITSAIAIATTTENKFEWPVWSFDWGNFGIGKSKKQNDIRDNFLPSDNWLSEADSEQSQSDEWLSNQWIGDDDSSIGPSSTLNTEWNLGPSIFSSNNWFSEEQLDQSDDQSDDSGSLSFEWMSQNDSDSIVETTNKMVQANLLGDNQSFLKSIWSDSMTELWSSDQDEGSTDSKPQKQITISDPGSGSGKNSLVKIRSI